METLEGLKKFLMENRAYILTTLAFYLLSGRLILEMPADWLILSSTVLTVTISLAYAGFNYIGREGLIYWLLSLILSLTMILLFFILTYQSHLPTSVPASQTCRNTVEAQCKIVSDGNISVPDNCLEDDSIMRDAIPYDLNEASNLNDTKVVCP